jgi:thiol-disulfide isomerase/thioredoxin
MKTIPLLTVLLFVAACQPPSVESKSNDENKVEVPVVKQESTPEKASKPAAVPTLVIETFNGEIFDLSKHKDKWVVVNFWATWCGPCLKEIPDFNAFSKQNPNVQFIGLAYEEIERADMEAFLKKHPIDYPFAIMDVYNPPADFDTPRGLPMTILIAPGGTVAKKFLGPIEAKDIKAVIDAAK